MDMLIEAINSGDYGWKADTCKYQKHHANYGGAQCEEQINLQIDDDVQDLAQKDDKADSNQAQSQNYASAWEKLKKFQKYASADQIPDSEIPKEFDLRDIDGVNFLGKVRDQGACGSCYTVAFTQAVESKLKVKYGKDFPQLSPQFLLNCNYMTEGCEGGWPHLHAYFAENGYLVEEKCAPYQSKTAGLTCSQYKDCKPVAKI